MKPRRETWTKKDLCDEIAARTKQSRAVVRLIVQEFLDGIVERLNKGQRLEFREFGVFEIKQRAARRAQNPKTLEPVNVPAKRTIKFKPGLKMRQMLEPTPASATPATKASREMIHEASRDAGAAAREPGRAALGRDRRGEMPVVELPARAATRA